MIIFENIKLVIYKLLYFSLKIQFEDCIVVKIIFLIIFLKYIYIICYI